MEQIFPGLNGQRPSLIYSTQQWYDFFYGDNKRDKKFHIYFNRVFSHFQWHYSFLEKYQILGKVYQYLRIPNVCGKLYKRKFLKVLNKEKIKRKEKLLEKLQNIDSFSRSPYRSDFSSACPSEFYLSPKSYEHSVRDISQLSTDSISTMESPNNFDCYFSSPGSMLSDKPNVISDSQRTSMQDLATSQISTLTNRSARTEQIEIKSSHTDVTQITDIISEIFTGVNKDMSILCKGEIFVDSKHNFIRKQSIFYEPCSKLDKEINSSLELMNILKDSDERPTFKMLPDVPTGSSSSDSVNVVNEWREKRKLSYDSKDAAAQFKRQKISTVISPSLSFTSDNVESSESSTESFPTTKSSICRLLIERK